MVQTDSKAAFQFIHVCILVRFWHRLFDLHRHCVLITMRDWNRSYFQLRVFRVNLDEVLRMLLSWHQAETEGMFIIWVTSQNHFPPFCCSGIHYWAPEIFAKHKTVFVSCQAPEEGSDQGSLRSSHTSFARLVVEPHMRTSWDIARLFFLQQAALPASEPRTVCVYTAVVYHKLCWVGFIFLLCKTEHCSVCVVNHFGLWPGLLLPSLFFLFFSRVKALQCNLFLN